MLNTSQLVHILLMILKISIYVCAIIILCDAIKQMNEKVNNEQDNPEIGEAVLQKKSKISIVWLLPLIALIIGGWLVYKSIAEGDIEIHVHFDSGSGLVAGKTEVKYEGISIGVVQDFHLDEDPRV